MFLSFSATAEADIDYQLVPAEENRDLARTYGIVQAPSIVITGDDGVTKYAGLGSIMGFLKNA